MLSSDQQFGRLNLHLSVWRPWKTAERSLMLPLSADDAGESEGPRPVELHLLRPGNAALRRREGSALLASIS